MAKKFTVTKIDKHENEQQVHMISDNGDVLRFFAGKTAWTFRAFVTGKISKKQLEKIIDVWYMLENQCVVAVGDAVIA
jgi:hypothetical protein